MSTQSPEVQTPAAPDLRFQCRHILTDGHRCGSPALRREDFCYFHRTTRIAAPKLSRSRSRDSLDQSFLELPPPEDRAAIQFSIGEVLRHIAQSRIEPRRAGLLLYGLQIASLNLPRQTAAAQAPAGPMVEELTDDPEHGPLAPRAEVADPQQEESVFDLLMEGLLLDRQQRQASRDAETTPATPTE